MLSARRAFADRLDVLRWRALPFHAISPRANFGAANLDARFAAPTVCIHCIEKLNASAHRRQLVFLVCRFSIANVYDVMMPDVMDRLRVD
jgi:hypothetical protein